MKCENNETESGLATNKPQFYENDYIVSFFKLLPALLVSANLDDLFLKDEVNALTKLKEALEEPDFSVVIFTDFLGVKERILKKVENINELDHDERVMILIYLVSSFENMINYHLFEELKIKRLTATDINHALRLPVEGKLGWLLKLLYGKGYTENENWPMIKKFIEARNFFVHYKTSTIDMYNIHFYLLTKDSFKDFLEAARNCDSYLKENHNEACKKQFFRKERIEAINEVISNLPSRPKNNRFNKALLDVILSFRKQSLSIKKN
jgi:hypothetical protein